eukprot:TRINITY_DN9200_c0_g1_i1.p1 TRINITY_DN9200_c0_g1~~TRINITY_DN9200_c0_g1_i1.p1  ORF type:complete len:136 (-),score=45.28 TRINITY_DN9200_c0_g1_i1:121-528(-)
MKLDKSSSSHLIHLCSLYNLRVHFFGSGKKRYATIKKTPRSCFPPPDIVRSFFAELHSSRKVFSKPLAPKSSGERRKIVGQVKVKQFPEIADDNIGKVMLKSMGWIGGGLGLSSQGMVAPLPLFVKNNKSGIGYQ